MTEYDFTSPDLELDPVREGVEGNLVELMNQYLAYRETVRRQVQDDVRNTVNRAVESRTRAFAQDTWAEIQAAGLTPTDYARILGKNPYYALRARVLNARDSEVG